MFFAISLKMSRVFTFILLRPNPFCAVILQDNDLIIIITQIKISCGKSQE